MRLVPILSTLAVLAAAPARACSIRPLDPNAPKPGQLAWVLGSVYGAHAIVRARAERVDSSLRPAPPFGRWGDVTFRVLDVVAADSTPPTTFIVFGQVTTNDDFNPGTVPYLMVSRDGVKGACFATEYRIGAEYLIFLQKPAGVWARSDVGLAPVKKQVRGANDLWVEWVRAERAKRPPR